MHIWYFNIPTLKIASIWGVKCIVRFYKPCHLYLQKSSRKQTLERKQCSLTELFLCVDCCSWSNPGMLAIRSWVYGFASIILAKVLALFRQGCGNVRHSYYSSLFLKIKNKSSLLKHWQSEITEARKNDNKRKTYKRTMLCATFTASNENLVICFLTWILAKSQDPVVFRSWECIC